MFLDVVALGSFFARPLSGITLSFVLDDSERFLVHSILSRH